MTAAPARGRTEIAGKVVERIATQALIEVDRAGGAARRVLGVPLGRPRGGPQVRVYIDGRLARLRMTVSVVYPEPVRQVTRQLREHVASRVGELTGLVVREVDIDVASLTTGTTRRGRP